MNELTFATCRVKRHRWDDIPITDGTFTPSFGVGEWMRCDRCGTVRKRIYNRFTLIVESSWYEYPEGYQYALDDRPSTAELRRLVLLGPSA